MYHVAYGMSTDSAVAALRAWQPHSAEMPIRDPKAVRPTHYSERQRYLST